MQLKPSVADLTGETKMWTDWLIAVDMIGFKESIV
jgi:hypothetical protein